MTAYTATEAGSTIPTRSGIGLCSRTASITTTATVATGDTFTFFDLPKGATLIYARLSWSASPGTTVPVGLGDAGSAARYISAAAMGGSASVAVINSGANVPFTVTTDDYALTATVGTVSSGASAGPILTCTAIWTMDK